MNTATNTISLKVNEGRLIQNLQHAFTNSHTVLGELLQNGRRAGASWISVNELSDDSSDEQLSLEIVDDGVGIDDPQTLLTIAESGWDEATVEQEQPYGVGFLAALYAARHIMVSSNGWVFSASTKQLLAGEPVEIRQLPAGKSVETNALPCASGTRILLFDIDLEREIERIMPEKAVAFPVPVMVNGELLKRKLAEDMLPFVDTSVGKVYIPGIHGGEGFGYSHYALCLQGQVVYSNAFSLGIETDAPVGYTVVHLDSKKYLARLPDRDKLINEQDVIEEVDELLHSMWMTHLLDEKERLSAADFLGRYYRKFCSNERLKIVFNDVPLLHSFHVATVDYYPEVPIPDSDNPALHGYGKDNVSQQDVESGKVKLVVTEELRDDISAEAWMFLYHAKGWIFVDRDSYLHQDHWAKRHLHTMTPQDIKVTLEGEQAPRMFTGNFTRSNIVFCERYTLEYNGESVTIDNDAFHSIVLKDGEIAEDRVIFPAAATHGGVVLQMFRAYDDCTGHQETDEELEIELLERFILSERSKDGAELLRAILSSAGTDYAVLNKHRFEVVFDSTGNPAVSQI